MAAVAALERMTRRGAVHCTSPGLAVALATLRSPSPGQPLSAYAGFDPTGPSLHLGHLAVVMGLRRLQAGGIRPIALVGGATALIGDPSGKSADRPLLSAEVVASNAAGIRRCLEGLLDLSSTNSSSSGSSSGLLVNNAAFYDGLGVLEFMRVVGTRFRLSAMLNKDSVRSRLEAPDTNSSSAGGSGGVAAATPPSSSAAATGMSYTEFSYQLFQAYDFLTLHRTAGCVLQVGGADQWGNITAGIEFVRRATATGTAAAAAAPAGAAVLDASAGGTEVHGLTVPLLTSSSGRKFGKSEAGGAGGGTVWLDPGLTSHHAFYQYLLNTADADVGRLLALLTELPEAQLAELGAAHAAAPERRTAQTALADALTTLVRGPDAAASARRTAAALFARRSSDGDADGSGSSGGGLAGLSSDEVAALIADGQLPSAAVTAAELAAGDGWDVADAAVRAGAAKSKAEARRLVAARGLYLNGARVDDARRRLAAPGDFPLCGGSVALLGAGRKKTWALRLTAETAAA